MDGWMERDVYCISVLQEGIFNCRGAFFFYGYYCLPCFLLLLFWGLGRGFIHSLYDEGYIELINILSVMERWSHEIFSLNNLQESLDGWCHGLTALGIPLYHGLKVISRTGTSHVV
jgi:hypothetical protein